MYINRIICIFLFGFLVSSSINAQEIWQPQTGLSWDIQLTGTLDLSENAAAYDFDLFDTDNETIANFKAAGHKIICYMSAGSFENWRPDANKFPRSVKGRSNGWAGEKWLDIRQISVLEPIMAARMDLAVAKGCDAIDPDNVDGYSNRTGFRISYNDQLVYNRLLAELAHARGLGVALKNDLGQIEDLVDYFDMAINESCYDYDECDLLAPFIDAGKPVLAIDYNGSTAICADANARGFSMLIKDELLSGPGVACWEE